MRRISPDLLVECKDRLTAFSCDNSKVVSLGMCADDDGEDGEYIDNMFSKSFVDYPVLLFLQRKHVEIAINNQCLVNHGLSEISSRLKSGMKTVMVYEDPQQQAKARSQIDLNMILRFAHEFFVAEKNSGSIVSDDVCIFQGLLRWFKGFFFKWYLT
jgi:hypothetical protein